MLTIKHIGFPGEKLRTSIATQGHRVIEKLLLVHDSGTLKHSKMSLIIIYLDNTGNRLWTQDASPAYFHIDKLLRRTIY